MNLDGITLHSAVEELSQALTGGQITKIYQLNGRGLYFSGFQRQIALSPDYYTRRFTATFSE